MRTSPPQSVHDEWCSRRRLCSLPDPHWSHKLPLPRPGLFLRDDLNVLFHRAGMASIKIARTELRSRGAQMQFTVPNPSGLLLAACHCTARMSSRHLLVAMMILSGSSFVYTSPAVGAAVDVVIGGRMCANDPACSNLMLRCTIFSLQSRGRIRIRTTNARILH
jgi:hypothetical protein